MELQRFYDTIVLPGLAFTQTHAAIPYDDRAKVGVMAIAGQESDWIARRQIGEYNPGNYQQEGARGYWEFEHYGATIGVLAMFPTQVAAVCKALDIPVNHYDIYEALAWNDTLACAFARLLLWSDPRPLPGVDQRDEWWQYYIRNWEPGAPDKNRWDVVFPQARALVDGSH